MNEHPSEDGRGRNRRRQYVVDKRLQYAALAKLVGVVVGVGVLYMLALVVFLGQDARVSMNSPEVRQFLVIANGLYFGVAAVILGTMTILLTHRFAGPAFVLRQAVDGMLEGDYGRRLSLRDRDHLKDLAASLSRLRDQIVAREARQADLLAEVGRRLEEGDVTGARSALARGDRPAAREATRVGG
jgi:hypothetical protein